VIRTHVGKAVTLDASRTTDPDGNRLTFDWFLYPEAGTGIPGRPVAAGPAIPIGEGGSQGEGGIPSATSGGPPQPPPRATVAGADRAIATATLRTPGVAHVILAVEDDGTPSLTAYRRIILQSGPPR
jgi:hypothetical protein